MPFAVEVHADRVGAEVAAARPVGVHVRHDVEGAVAAQHAGDRIVGIGQLLERAFHPPFGHRLAGMLAGIEPHGQVALADRQAVDVLPVEALAEAAVFDAGKRRDGRHQIVVPLHRIRREIGDPDQVGFRHEADGQHAVGVAGAGDAGPILAVDRHAGLIVGPAVGIGGAAAIDDPQRHLAAAGTGQAEVEPLVEIAHVILDDFEIDRVAACSTTRMLPASNALEIVMVMNVPAN